MALIPVDDQPISAGFFKEGRWLTEYVTPDALEVKTLYKKLTKDAERVDSKIAVCHQFVGGLKYEPFISGTLVINGKTSKQEDLWMTPSMVARTKVGNCFNKAILMTSLLRNFIDSSQVYTVLGNLYNGEPGGHAWVETKLEEANYLIESTRADVPTLVPTGVATRYEAVQYFNDKEVLIVEGRTVMEPFSNFYSVWLKDYLDWAYIEGSKRR